MRLLFDNVNFSSSSGPNSFGLKLAKELSRRGHVICESHENPEVQLSFISALKKAAPLVQRIDGVWFNSTQDWKLLNVPIESTFKIAEAVVVQSEFDRQLVKHFFGDRDNVITIRNGAEVNRIQSIDPLSAPSLHDVSKVWSCASSWRPHKRLAENIRYFLEHAEKNDCLVIAGANPDVAIADPRIFYAGNLDPETLFSLYRASDYFIHLAWLDHSPNVVADARAAGSHIICSSAGGTEEIAGLDSTVVEEDPWEIGPCDLYKPPPLDFTRTRPGRFDTSIDIVDVATQYERVLQGAI